MILTSLIKVRILSFISLNLTPFILFPGGISSYSAILLIVAYMNNFKLQTSPHITPSRLLMGFLDFYSNCFDSRKYGINILNEM